VAAYLLLFFLGYVLASITGSSCHHRDPRLIKYAFLGYYRIERTLASNSIGEYYRDSAGTRDDELHGMNGSNDLPGYGELLGAEPLRLGCPCVTQRTAGSSSWNCSCCLLPIP
jgi:hypothetical protein